MNYVEQLIEDLETLNKHYKELSNLNYFLNNKDDNEGFKARLTEAGQLLIDFYKKTFIPVYSKIQNFLIEDVGEDLWSFSEEAYYCLENNMPLAVLTILTKSGDRIKSKNNLEKLIIRVAEMLREKERAIV